MNLPLRRARVLLAVFALCASGVAFGAAASAAKYYEDALARYERNDVNGAIVQLKNALQQDPTMLQAYMLMGKAQLRAGDPAAAEDAYDKALNLGVSRVEVLVPLGRAYMQQAEYQRLLEKLTPDGLPPATRAEVLALRAQAQMAGGDLSAAQQSLDQAQAAAPQSLAVVSSRASLLQQRGDLAGALKLADQAVALAPGDAKTWQLKATIEHAAGDARDALADYDKAVAADPQLLDARLARLALLLDLGRDDEVARGLNALKTAAPDEPRAAYLRAVLASRRGDQAATRDALAEITRMVDPIPPDKIIHYPQLVLLGGVAHYGLGEKEKAKAYLEMMLKLDPRHVGVRKLLGSLLISSGELDDAISVLDPARQLAPGDPYVLSLLASANMGKGRYARAADLLDQAVKLEGATPRMRADLGLSLLGEGQAASALDQLQQAFSREPGDARAGVAIAVMQLRAGRAQQAVQVMGAVVKRNPRNLVALNLLGVARVAAGDKAGGRKAYQQALALDASFVPARLNLARLDETEGHSAQARARLMAILKDFPNDSNAMFEMAHLEAASGNMDAAISWAQKARDFDRKNPTSGLYLVDLYMRQGKRDKALAVANDLVAFFPENLYALEALGRVDLAMGKSGDASSLFTRMTRLAQYEVEWQYRIAQLQRQAGDLRGALYCLEKALSSQPDHLPSLILAAQIELRMGNIAGAEKRVAVVRKRYPDRAVADSLAADVAMARKDYRQAIVGYRAALTKEDSAANAIRLIRAYVETGDAAQGARFLQGWVRAHPGQPDAMRALAEVYLRAGNLAAARQNYEAVLKLQSDDASVLNNLAYILNRQGDRAGAAAYANRAYQLAPHSATVNDTLGWVLVAQGQLDQALLHLRDAHLRDPENSEIRYHLAVALNLAGHPKDARQELQQALQGNANFDGVEDARKLLRRLEGH